MEDHTGYTIGVNNRGAKDDSMSYFELTSNSRVKKKLLFCHICEKVLSHRSSLYKHIKFIHKIDPAQRLPILCHEVGCSHSFPFIDPFRKHLVDYHGFKVDIDKYVFQSMQEFSTWKYITEKTGNARYIVSTGPRATKSGRTHYYRCSRNGIYKPELKKRLLISGSDSATPHCISSMFVYEEPNCVTVEYCKTHYGHHTNDASLLLPPRLKTYHTKLYKDSQNIEPEINLTDSEIVLDNKMDVDLLLSNSDKYALKKVITENEHILEEAQMLFYENSENVMLRITPKVLNILKNLSDVDPLDENEVIPSAGIKSEPVEDPPTDSEDTLSVWNSNVMESIRKAFIIDLDGSCTTQDVKVEDTEDNTEIYKEIEMLSEEDDEEDEDEDNILSDMEKAEKIIFSKRKNILSQLQTILVFVNKETDIEVLENIEEYLSQFSPSDD